MTERDAVIETIARLFRAADQHRWDDLAALFGDQVTLDYTAARGGDPDVLTRDAVVAGWRPLFTALDAHQHLVANHLVAIDSEQANVTASFIATHQWHGETWTLGGDYAFELVHTSDSWLVTSMTMTPVWQTGATDLVERVLGG